MKAIGYQHASPIDQADALQDIELPMPTATGHDVLVEVKAVSVNPVDAKVRNNASAEKDEWKVLGWDATGVVKTVGPDVTLFKVGDKVWYAGDISRSGSNAQFQLVDERIVGRMPQSLSYSDAAALPLTSITAWEMLFERLEVEVGKKTNDKSIMIIGAAGGVGSIMVQLAKRLTGLTIIGTASRPETKEWLEELGTHHVIDHSKPLSQELKKIGFDNVDYVVSLNNTDQHYGEIVESLAPQGKFGLIDDPASLDVLALKRKSISLHWELMFTRSLFKTDDMQAQHDLLNEVSELIDEGLLKTTVGNHFGTINAKNIIKAHGLLESQKAKGKIVLEGF
ncbi:zinc-binding alcohol dehydrogenase family protein [Vibrio sp. DW001]|uniref:zinc-binding alcohol dehydrogenase family protein n=1 Tax=Vibrio sp. DW001 TaxID=2912315 RepID=UPI0023AE8753|nr:zinc-binding alcohol dehydrogenase family protein [Vibrio sp. DW001]WED29008.1 zinc-binding alcohol dehydrogenase family protein [Vibrio sp. DW001]